MYVCILQKQNENEVQRLYAVDTKFLLLIYKLKCYANAASHEIQREHCCHVVKIMAV